MRNIIIISGPSGCGKSTLIHELLAEFPELHFSVSHTTRPMRKNEVPGKDYHFISEREFQKMLDGDQFVEWAEVHGHRYGTSWKEIRAKSGKGRTLVLDIDSQGARNIKRQFPEAMAIFVVPPTLAALKKRLLQRQGKLDREARQQAGRRPEGIARLPAVRLRDRQRPDPGRRGRPALPVRVVPPADAAQQRQDQETSAGAKMKLILGVSGSIGAYKAMDIMRLFQKNDHEVTVVMTRAATRIIPPLTFATFAPGKVFHELFAEGQDPLLHINLSRGERPAAGGARPRRTSSARWPTASPTTCCRPCSARFSSAWSSPRP